eukprot:TRINITY_DN47555_c0_g1_i1.p1 TRINITY_DN47555_c0_g1~~TRINITY_DN47555_c0_g1_i1.p1  ORF type:complete len:397 (-),score=76.74 TRINITY_DN47555_c0_g1_i1:40-1230(-)
MLMLPVLIFAACSTQLSQATGMHLKGAAARSKSALGSSAGGGESADYFNPIFSAPQLTPKQFLLISSSAEQKVVYTELKNFKSTTGRTFALVDSGLTDPRGIALDRDRGALYVADKGAKSIFRYHVYVDDSHSGLALTTDGVQLSIMQKADVEWLHVDVNGDVFYSDETSKTINRIPVHTIEMLSKGEFGAGDLSLISEQQMVASNSSVSDNIHSREVYAIYEGATNPHVSTPAGVVSDGARLYWVNAVDGKKVGTVAEGFVDPHLPKQEKGGKVAAAFPSVSLSNETDTASSIAKSNKLIFFASAERGTGKVSSLTSTGQVFDIATGLSQPKGLAWDGDQTLYVADEAASAVYSLPVGRLMENAPLTRSAVLNGAFGLALFSEFDKAWTMRITDK